jgi:Domain of unknown function (DUF5615)
VRLLLDVHHSPRAADRLIERGFDVAAAAKDPDLATMADEDLLRHATLEGRALVTENLADFGSIIHLWTTTGENHAGIVFTSPRRFHRGSASYPENLVASLNRLLEQPPEAEHDWVHWLE